MNEATCEVADVNELLFSLKQNIESLELRCDELSKQVDEITHNLEQEKRKSERLRESSSNEVPAKTKFSSLCSKERHTSSSASEPESEEVRRKV